MSRFHLGAGKSPACNGRRGWTVWDGRDERDEALGLSRSHRSVAIAVVCEKIVKDAGGDGVGSGGAACKISTGCCLHLVTCDPDSDAGLKGLQG